MDCNADGRWPDAETIFGDWGRYGQARDDHAVLVLYKTYIAAGRWHAMLYHFQLPANAPLMLDSQVCALLLEELWNSGARRLFPALCNNEPGLVRAICLCESKHAKERCFEGTDHTVLLVSTSRQDCTTA